MQKILISEWVPNQCLEPYKDEFSFTLPDKEKHAFSYDEVLAQIADYDGYLILDNDGDKKLIDAAKNLKVIANFGVGYNNIDWEYATKVGLPVVNTPTQVTEATAEHAMTLIAATMRGIARYDREVRRGEWNSPNFTDIDTELYDRTLGICGFGRIGKRVCRKAQGMGMKVIYTISSAQSQKLRRNSALHINPSMRLSQRATASRCTCRMCRRTITSSMPTYSRE